MECEQAALAGGANEQLLLRRRSSDNLLCLPAVAHPRARRPCQPPSAIQSFMSSEFWNLFCNWVLWHKITDCLKVFGWLSCEERMAINRLRALAAQTFSADNEVHERLLARYFTAALKILSLETFNDVVDLVSDNGTGPREAVTSNASPASSAVLLEAPAEANSSVVGGTDVLTSGQITPLTPLTPRATTDLGQLGFDLESQAVYDNDGTQQPPRMRSLTLHVYEPMRWGGLDAPQLGFQSSNPRTDFRGGGALSLRAMVYFAEKHPTFFRRFLESALLEVVAELHPMRSPSGRVLNRTYRTEPRHRGSAESAGIAHAASLAAHTVDSQHDSSTEVPLRASTSAVPRTLPSMRRHVGRCSHLERLQQVESPDGWAGSMVGFPFSAGLIVLSGMLMLYFGLVDNAAPLSCHPDNDAAKPLVRRTSSSRGRAIFAELLTKHQLAFLDLFSAAAIRFHLEWTARFRREYQRTGSGVRDTSRLFFNSLVAVKKEVVSLFEVRHNSITVVEDLYDICRYPHLATLD